MKNMKDIKKIVHQRIAFTEIKIQTLIYMKLYS